MKKRFETQVINDEILKKLNLSNRYNFLNENLSFILTENEFMFLKEVQDFCLKFEKDNKIRKRH